MVVFDVADNSKVIYDLKFDMLLGNAAIKSIKDHDFNQAVQILRHLSSRLEATIALEKIVESPFFKL